MDMMICTLSIMAGYLLLIVGGYVLLGIGLFKWLSNGKMSVKQILEKINF